MVHGRYNARQLGRRGEPARFPLNRVIAGWIEGVQLMVVGKKRRLWIPTNLAYGTRSGYSALISPGAMLVFDIDLLSTQ